MENLAGKTTLRELCAALKLCRVLLTNDTGPMHIGAAVGTKVVALFGSTAPELTAPGLPWAEGHEALKPDRGSADGYDETGTDWGTVEHFPRVSCRDNSVVVSLAAVCSPCFRRECPVDLRCMKAITVQEVVNAVLRLM